MIVAVGALCLATEAGATMITLSTGSSESTIAPSLLDATLDFSVTGGNQLKLTVGNLSGYDITAIYFNASSKVLQLSLDKGVKKWSLAVSSEPAGGFGMFDFAVAIPDAEAANDRFDAGGSAQFTFSFSKDSSIDASDFAAELSLANGGDSASLAAASFSAGSGGVIGAVIHLPEPSTALLFGAGTLCLAVVRRRRADRR